MPFKKAVLHEKKIGHSDCSPWAHREVTVSSRWPKWSQPAVTEPWPGSWLSCDLAVTEPWSYWRCRDWAVTSPWLSCDLAVTELWPRRDWAVTSPSRDWAVIIGPGAVTTVVTGDNFFLMGIMCCKFAVVHIVKKTYDFKYVDNRASYQFKDGLPWKDFC